MEADFWHQRWQGNQIAFHEQGGNELLARFFGHFNLAQGKRIFVPLCGKSKDIGWLLSKGYRVCGAELSELAVEALFADLGVDPTITETGSLRHYQVEGLDIFLGDIFALTGEQLGSVDAIYDRAALVALPDDMRRDYAAHLVAITGAARQFLISFTYDQSLLPGPPFSVPEDMVRSLYSGAYEIDRLEEIDVPGGLKGKCPAKETVWDLRPA
ncbi:MAG: thiopurine S-methyltransferase [Magnetovibrionaceae bacterium]